MKKCNVCNELLVLANDFYTAPSTKDGFRGDCKKCSMKQRRDRLAKAHPDQRRSVSLKNRYGITLDDFNDLLRGQEDRCMICRNWHTGSRNCFVVDHCHKTGYVRGLLCQRCNVGLGLLRDDVIVLKKLYYT